jgi:hypothetical protein
MDQLDPSLIQRVDMKVSAVVERYLLDNRDVTPKNTLKAYAPKQAEWMVSRSSRPLVHSGPAAHRKIIGMVQISLPRDPTWLASAVPDGQSPARPPG